METASLTSFPLDSESRLIVPLRTFCVLSTLQRSQAGLSRVLLDRVLPEHTLLSSFFVSWGYLCPAHTSSRC